MALKKEKAKVRTCVRIVSSRLPNALSFSGIVEQHDPDFADCDDRHCDWNLHTSHPEELDLTIFPRRELGRCSASNLNPIALSSVLPWLQGAPSAIEGTVAPITRTFLGSLHPSVAPTVINELARLVQIVAQEADVPEAPRENGKRWTSDVAR
eukprot:scaffold3870_cov246-Pinguiococcus_pyrenoidosus.AAC.8